jgi:DNA-binding PadR family transcriptional regulator
MDDVALPIVKRTSQTQLAVLGGLSVEPMTGYALRQAIQETLGHFWSESFGQIYPALATLESQGMVRRQGQGQTSGSRFEITDAGLAQLREWLGEPFEQAPARNALLLRLFFGRHLGEARCRELLIGVREDAERRLAEYVPIRAELEGAIAVGDPDAKYFLITLASGEISSAAIVSWVEEALALLDR